MAAIVGVKKVIEHPDRVLYINITSILNLLEWIRTTQNNLKRLLFASTSEVYAAVCGAAIYPYRQART